MNDRDLAKKIGALIRRLRQEAGMSQEGFADSCGLHRTYIGSVERGEKAITIETAHKIVKALGMSLSHFFQVLEGGEN